MNALARIILSGMAGFVAWMTFGPLIPEDWKMTAAAVIGAAAGLAMHSLLKPLDFSGQK